MRKLLCAVVVALVSAGCTDRASYMRELMAQDDAIQADQFSHNAVEDLCNLTGRLSDANRWVDPPQVRLPKDSISKEFEAFYRKLFGRYARRVALADSTCHMGRLIPAPGNFVEYDNLYTEMDQLGLTWQGLGVPDSLFRVHLVRAAKEFFAENSMASDCFKGNAPLTGPCESYGRLYNKYKFTPQELDLK